MLLHNKTPRLRPQGAASQPPFSQTGHEVSNQHSHSDNGA